MPLSGGAQVVLLAALSRPPFAVHGPPSTVYKLPIGTVDGRPSTEDKGAPKAPH